MRVGLSSSGRGVGERIAAEMHFQLLFGELGGFGYDTCAAFGNYGNNGVTPLGCDEFFPPPQVYKDLRSNVSSQAL